MQLEPNLPLRRIVNYNLPTLGIGFMFFLVTLYLMKFATDVLLIAPAAMGLIFGLSRIWDAITDPVVGYLSDRTNTAMGRRRPWMLACIPFVCGTFYMMWNPPASLGPSSSIAWMAVAVLAFYTAMTAFTVPHVSLGAELTVNYHERNRVFGVRHMAYYIGAMIALIAMYMLIGADEPRAVAFDISLLVGAVTALLLVWMFFTTSERPEYQGRGETNVFTAFGDVMKNSHARLLLLVFFIENIGAATIGILTPYIAQYIVGTPELTVVYILSYLVPSVGSVPFWLPISRRIGKKNLWLFSLMVTGVGFGSMYFVGEGDVWLYASLAFVCGLGAGSGALVAPSIQADIIDFDEYQSGKRKEGAYFAAWNFVHKSATGITLMLTGFVLGLSGFVPNEPQSELTKFAIIALYTLFPLVCYILGAIILNRFSMTEASHRQIREALDRGERASP